MAQVHFASTRGQNITQQDGNCSVANFTEKCAVLLQAARCFLESCSSAFSNFVIFSAMEASSACATSLLRCANTWAANLPILAGFTMKALEDPGGFVRQVLFIPSGGQDTTGNLAKYDAVPDNASVPPAQPTIMIGRAELLYSSMTD